MIIISSLVLALAFGRQASELHLWIIALPCCANDIGGGPTPVGPCHLCREPHTNQCMLEPSYFLSWKETMGSLTGRKHSLTKGSVCQTPSLNSRRTSSSGGRCPICKQQLPFRGREPHALLLGRRACSKMGSPTLPVSSFDCAIQLRAKDRNREMQLSSLHIPQASSQRKGVPALALAQWD